MQFNVELAFEDTFFILLLSVTYRGKIAEAIIRKNIYVVKYK